MGYGASLEAVVTRRILIALLLCACGRSNVYRYASSFDAGEPMSDAGQLDGGRVPCIPGHITLVRANPVVMLVLDRSGSMGFRFGQVTRWQALVNGLKM